MSYIANNRFGAAVAISALLFVQVVWGQYSPEPPVPAYAGPAKLLSGQQLDKSVAPIALYPDPLLGEVLAASTYPFEIAEAQQWVQDHSTWKPSKLMNEAKKQNWDPSIQGLVAFPQVLARLYQGVSWTTSLGNAVLASGRETSIHSAGNGNVGESGWARCNQLLPACAQLGELCHFPEGSVVAVVESSGQQVEDAPRLCRQRPQRTRRIRGTEGPRQRGRPPQVQRPT
jgi:hypothetical protein